jgi:hypothetical protein
MILRNAQGPYVLFKLYENVLILKNDPIGLHRLNRRRCQSFSGAQVESSPMQRALDRFGGNLPFRKRSFGVRADIADREQCSTDVEDCDRRIFDPLHPAGGKIGFGTNSE